MKTKDIVRSNKIIRKSVLNESYKMYISGILNALNNDEDEIRWEIYNLILSNFYSKGKINLVDEYKYRVTDGEDPNVVILDIIHKYPYDIDGTVWSFKKRLEDFIEDDFIKRFLP